MFKRKMFVHQYVKIREGIDTGEFAEAEESCMSLIDEYGEQERTGRMEIAEEEVDRFRFKPLL